MMDIYVGGVYQVKFVSNIWSGAPKKYEGNLCTVTRISGTGTRQHCYISCNGESGYYVYPCELTNVDYFHIQSVCDRLKEMKVCIR